MSIEHILSAFKAKTGSSGRKLVLIKLADNANDNGLCWPSHQYIADQCEMSKRSVINHIAKLEEMGFLTIQHRKKEAGGNHSNYYRLHIEVVKNLHGDSENSAPPPSANSAPRTSHSLESVNEPIGLSSDKPVDVKSNTKNKYTEEFEKIWRERPSRVGGNPKPKALKAYNARLKEGHTSEKMLAGVKRYKQHLEEQQKMNTPFVMQMATFLGPDEHFAEQWTFNETGKPANQRSIRDL